MKNAYEDSATRLGRDADILQLHWPPAASNLNLQEANYLKAFHELMVEQGRPTQLGVSNYGPKNLRRICKLVDGLNDPQKKSGPKQIRSRIASNQVQFSLLSRYPLQTGLEETCEELDVQLIGYSPLALGLLTDKVRIVCLDVILGLHLFLRHLTFTGFQRTAFLVYHRGQPAADRSTGYTLPRVLTDYETSFGRTARHRCGTRQNCRAGLLSD